MAFAATPPYDGTLAKYYILPEDFCYKLSENVTLDEGALVEPLSVAVHIVRQANVRPGQSVVVFGAGPVGLFCATVAKAFGASKIISVDIIQEKLDFAKKYAATGTFMPTRVPAEENAARMIKENELGDGADVAIDASGAEPSIQTAIYVLRTAGIYVQAGMGKPDVNFPITVMLTKEITVRGSFRYAEGDYKLAIDLIERGLVKVKDLVTSRVNFWEAEKAFEQVKAGKGIKVLIDGPTA